MKQYSSLSFFFEKNKMEIDEKVLNEFFVYLCSDNPDILHKNVLIFFKSSFCWFVMWERRKSKDENDE